MAMNFLGDNGLGESWGGFFGQGYGGGYNVGTNPYSPNPEMWGQVALPGNPNLAPGLFPQNNLISPLINYQQIADPNAGNNAIPNGYYVGPSGDLLPLSAGSSVPNGFYLGPNGQQLPLSTGSPIPPAPTQSQINANPSQFSGTSFDPSRYLTFPGSPYGNGTGNGNNNGNPFSGATSGRAPFVPDTGNGGAPFAGNPNAGYNGPTGVFDPRLDPTGVNHNIFANFLRAQSPVALVLAQMLTAGEGPMRQAQQWLAANVAPEATTANPNANSDDLMRAWGSLNASIAPNGNATPGVPGLGNGIGANGLPPPPATLPPPGTPTPGGNTPPPGGGTQTPPPFQLNSDLTGYLAQIDNYIRSAGYAGEITDDVRRSYHYPTQAELQMNQQYRQANPNSTLDAGQFLGGIPTNAPYQPTNAAPAGFQYKWYDPDNAGPAPPNYYLVSNSVPKTYAEFQQMQQTLNDPRYGNKGFGFADTPFSALFQQSAPGTTSGNRFSTPNIGSEQAYGQWLNMQGYNDPFRSSNLSQGTGINSQGWPTNYTGPTALQNYMRGYSVSGGSSGYTSPTANVASQPQAVQSALSGHAYDPGPEAGYIYNTPTGLNTEQTDYNAVFRGTGTTPTPAVSTSTQSAANPWSDLTGAPGSAPASSNNLW